MTCNACGRLIERGDEVLWRRRSWHPRCVAGELEAAISAEDRAYPTLRDMVHVLTAPAF